MPHSYTYVYSNIAMCMYMHIYIYIFALNICKCKCDSPYIYIYWLVVSTPLKNISQLGLLLPIYGKTNVPNHQPVYMYTAKLVCVYTYICICKYISVNSFENM